jgi:hypothetical protein
MQEIRRSPSSPPVHADLHAYPLPLPLEAATPDPRPFIPQVGPAPHYACKQPDLQERRTP